MQTYLILTLALSSVCNIAFSATKKPTLKPIISVGRKYNNGQSPMKICQYGGYCKTDSDCVKGNYCKKSSSYYSQCLPNPASYSKSSCKANYGAQCSSDYDCCDPGAYCNSKSYRQCQQPAVGSGFCSNPSSYSVNNPVASPVATPIKTKYPTLKPIAPSSAPVTIAPSSAPVTIAPTIAPVTAVPSTRTPTSQLKICQYSGYCNKNSDCHSGNTCLLNQMPYYSQCVPDSSTYRKGSCANNWGNKCSSDSDCCDPGAYCNFNSFRQCQQPAIGSSKCVNPAKKSFPTSMPIKPSFKPSSIISLVPSKVPTANPTYNNQVTLTFTTTLSLVGVSCSQISNCSACQTSISQTVAMVLSVNPPDTVLYFQCGLRRRLYEQRSRRLGITDYANVTVIVKLNTQDPKGALSSATSTLTAATPVLLTSTLQMVSGVNGATATQSATIFASQTSQPLTITAVPSKAPTDMPTTKPSANPSDTPSTKPSTKLSDKPSVKPTNKQTNS
jgi:hypothetical protein